MPNAANRLQLGFLLSDASRILKRIIDKRARCIGVSRAQWVVLLKISRNEGLRQIDLAADMEMEPISIGRQIDKLTAAGLVERRPDPADRRAYRLYLLPAATPVIEEVRAIADSILESALAQFGDAELDHLVAAIGDLRENLLTIESTGNDDVGQSETDPASRERA